MLLPPPGARSWEALLHLNTEDAEGLLRAQPGDGTETPGGAEMPPGAGLRTNITRGAGRQLPRGAG